MSSEIIVIAHGDPDGIASAAILAEQLGINTEDIRVIFTQPYLVDRIVIPNDIENVYVVDIAINNRDPKMTADFVRKLRGKLVRWYDHHGGWDDYYADNRFTTTQTHACAEQIGNSNDIRVQDAVASDIREGAFSTTGLLIEHAIKADMSNDETRLAAVKLLMGDESQRQILEIAARDYGAILDETYRIAASYGTDPQNTTPYKVVPAKLAVVDATASNHKYDLTLLLLKGQEYATFAVVKTRNQKTSEVMVTIATKSDTDLVDLFGLKSGAKFRVTLPADRLNEVFEKLNEVV